MTHPKQWHTPPIARYSFFKNIAVYAQKEKKWVTITSKIPLSRTALVQVTILYKYLVL